MTNLSQYTVTIKIESGVIGHAFVTLQAPGQPPITVGYYPVVHSPSAPGIVVNDALSGKDKVTGQLIEHPSDWSRTFSVSAGQYEAMLAKVAFVSNHPGEYGVLGNQCTGFVRDVLNAGGITPTGVGQFIDGAAHPLNLRWAYGDMPENQFKAFRGDASGAGGLIDQITNGISKNPERLQQYKDDHTLPSDATLPDGGYWFGAELNDTQWNNADTLSAQAAALANAAIPIVLAGEAPDLSGLMALQNKVAEVAQLHLGDLGDDLKVYKDANGSVLVVGSNGAMQINRDGSVEVVNATAQGMTNTQYDAGAVLSASGSLNKADGSYTQVLFNGSGQVQGVITTQVLDNGSIQKNQFDAKGALISTTNTQTFDDGSQLELKTEGGKTYVRSLVPNEEGGVDRSEWSELKASQPELSPQAYQQLIYSDMAGFLSALRNGDKLNQALYGVKLTLDVMLSQGKTLDQSMAGLRDGLDAVAGAVGVVAALHALQSDDTLTQLNGAVGLLSSSNQLFAAINGGAIGEGLTTNGFLNKGDLAALQVVSSLIALSNLKNLDNMLDNGQVGSAGATVYQAVKAVQFLAAAAETGSLTQAAAGTAPDLITAVIIVVVAWALDEIFAEDAPPPPPKPPAGWAEFKLVNDSLSWVFHDKMADGQGFGYADTVMGKTILNEKMSKLISTLKTQLEQANRGSTDTDRELCVVASRIPKLYLQSWLVGADETNGKDNYHFLLESTHAQTGEKTYQPIARQDIDKDFSYSQSCAFTRRRTHKQNRHHTTQGAQHA